MLTVDERGNDNISTYNFDPSGNYFISKEFKERQDKYARRKKCRFIKCLLLNNTTDYTQILLVIIVTNSTATCSKLILRA